MDDGVCETPEGIGVVRQEVRRDDDILLGTDRLATDGADGLAGDEPSQDREPVGVRLPGRRMCEPDRLLPRPVARHPSPGHAPYRGSRLRDDQ